MLRRAFALALIAAMVGVGVPTTILAQDQFSVGSISGLAIDAAGRSVAGQQIELLQGTQVVSVSKTSAKGEWSFRDVKAGDYVVRVNVNGKLSGVRVSIIGGRVMAGTVIVVSTASVSPQLGLLGTLLSTLAPSVVSTVTAAAVAAGYETETTQLNDEILEDILAEMSPQARVAFAQAVLEAVEEAGTSGSPFSQYVGELTVIIITGGAVVPEFPPPTSSS